MKKKLICSLIIALFPISVLLILLGNAQNNGILVYTGVGILFGGGFLLAVTGAVVLFLRARKKADEMDQPEKGENPERETVRNRYTEAEDAFAYSIHGFRHLSAKNKALGVLFLTFTLGSVFTGLILLFFKQFVAAYVCFGCFAAGIFAGILAAIISSLNIAPRKKQTRKEGSYTATVLRCDPYSSSYSYSTNDNGETAIRYRIYLEIEGKEYETRDSVRYEAGEKVTVCFVDGLAIITRQKNIVL